MISEFITYQRKTGIELHDNGSYKNYILDLREILDGRVEILKNGEQPENSFRYQPMTSGRIYSNEIFTLFAMSC